MKLKQRSSNFGVLALAAVLLFSANLNAGPFPQSSSQQQSPSGVSVDPSTGPLQPSGTPPAEARPAAPLPDAPQPLQSSQAPAVPKAPQPLGAAAAEQVKTAGGGASRPAGDAIAPVKQHQYRSLVIKLGAVAAAGIAAGAVYGLSRATPGAPPHSASAAAR